MKKILALFLSLMMALGCAPAMADGVEDLYEGAWVRFEDDFQMYMPAAWPEREITKEEAEMGTLYSCGTPDVTKAMTVIRSPLPTETVIDGVEVDLIELGIVYDIETLQQTMEELFSVVERVKHNGFDVLCASDPANNTLMFTLLDPTMDPAQPAMYSMIFAPASDAGVQNYAVMMMTSLCAAE